MTLKSPSHGSRTVLLALLLVLCAGFAATSSAQPLLDPMTQPKFVNPVPNPLDPGFIYQPTTPGGTHYEVGMHQVDQWLGLVDPVTLAPLTTTVWGYGTAPGFPNATFPGRTFVAQRDQQITVRWTNDLVDGGGAPLPHLLPVDETLHWAFSLPGYEFNNLLNDGVPVVPHLHGGHTESDSDGLPEYWFTPGFGVKGPRWVKETYVYDNDQPSGTLWYHDHGLGITRLNVYAGLAGFYILRDELDTGLADNPLGLPSYPYELPLVIQDRMFTADGQLFYPTTDPMMLPPGAPIPSALPEFFGDHILVNGVAWPVMDVEPRKYRLRLLNGSDSRFYDLFPGGVVVNGVTVTPTIHVIGTDDGLLYAPVPVQRVLIGPGERYDLVVDFAGLAGQQIILKNNARSPYPKGGTVNPQTTGQIMAFRVGTTVNVPDQPLPATLLPTPITPAQVGTPVRTRRLALFEGTDSYGRLQPMLGVAQPTMAVNGQMVDGALLWDEMHSPITENPMLDDVEIWEVYNATADAHPIHLHLVSFQILGRQKYKAALVPKPITAHDGSVSTGFTLQNIKTIGQQRPPELYELGWKDTALMYPGEVTRIVARFDREGRYVWHCHILSHEDHEMMRPYYVGPFPGAGAPMLAKREGVAAPQRGIELSVTPSPFNPSTSVFFRLDVGGPVRLHVYDVRGRLVRTLLNEERTAGEHSISWNGKDDGGRTVASGVYFAQLEAAGRSFSHKMVMSK